MHFPKKALVGFVVCLTMFSGCSSTFATENEIDTSISMQANSQENNTVIDSNEGDEKKAVDEQYPFTLQFPNSWKEHVYINQEKFNDIAKDFFNFSIKIKGEHYPVCTIFTFDNNEDMKEYVESGPLTIVKETDTLIYAYIRAETPEEYWISEHMGEFQKMYDMITKEITIVMSSFKLLD